MTAANHLKTIRFFVTGFGLGRLPLIPGTFGTLGAVPLVVLLGDLSPVAYAAVAVGLTIFAIALCQVYEKLSGAHDPGEIVIDEIAGYVVAMAWLPLTVEALALSFLLFRILDMFKPFPISVLDRRVKGGFGVVVDDIAAGLITNLVLQLIYFNTNWLGFSLAS